LQVIIYTRNLLCYNKRLILFGFPQFHLVLNFNFSENIWPDFVYSCGLIATCRIPAVTKFREMYFIRNTINYHIRANCMHVVYSFIPTAYHCIVVYRKHMSVGRSIYLFHIRLAQYIYICGHRRSLIPVSYILYYGPLVTIVHVFSGSNKSLLVNVAIGNQQ